LPKVKDLSRAARTSASRSQESPDPNRHIARRGRPAAIGIVVILLGVSGFAVWASHATATATRNASLANRLSDAYARADSAVAAEESLERKYRLEPSPAVRANYNAAAASFVTALGDVKADGDVDEVTFVTKILAQQAGYLAAVNRMFAAVDLGDTPTVLKIDGGEVDPSFGAIETEVATEAATEHIAALKQLANLHRLETLTSRLTPAVFGLGLLLAGLLAAVTRGYRRELLVERARAVEHSMRDPLTGLPNRTLLAERFQLALQAPAHSDSATALLLIDIDRFKEINDTFGHQYGDQLLNQIGRRFAAVVGDRDTVARIGGDEFAVLLPHTKDLAAATEIAECLRHCLERSFQVEGVDLEVEASIGVVLSGEHGTDAETLLQHADVAMYVAKTRNVGVFAYSTDIDGYSPERLALLGDLRRALELHEIVLHYQPKVSVVTGEVVGVEALARWEHPTRGLLFPDAFIPAAEHTGLIGPFTSYVLDAALAQARIWSDQGRPLVVSVNLSGRNLLDENLPAEVSDLLALHAVPAALLELEVTESAIMLDPVRARRLLETLSELGIRLSIDDFGAGYTSLGQLKTLPVDELKIDRSFVMTMTSDARDALIVHSVIELGQNLGLSIVAEGVETAEALATLHGFGCDIAQGYHIAKPASVEIFDAWLLARRIPARVPSGVTHNRRAGDAVLAQRDFAEPTSPAGALRASEERFRALFTRAPIGIAEARSDGTLVAVNPRLCMMLGYEVDELIGQPAVMLADPGDRAEQARDMATLSSSDGYAARRLYRRKDGTTFSALVSVAVVRQISGAVHRMVAMLVDISELAAAQQSIAAAGAELAAHQMFTDSLLASASAGIIACDSSGQITIMNRTARSWHGLDPDIEPTREQLKQLTSDLFEADGTTPLAIGSNPLRRAFREGSTWKAELIIAPAHAAATRVIATGTALHGSAGEVVGAVITMHDITLLGQRESELHDAGAALVLRTQFDEAVLESVNVGVMACDVDENVVLRNAALRRLTGLPDGERVGLDGAMARIAVSEIDGTEMSPQMPPLRRALAGEPMLDVPVRIGPLNGPGRDVTVTAHQIYDREGGVLGAVATFTDVTSERQIQAQLRESAAFHDAVLAASPDVIFVAEASTNRNMWSSKKLTEVLGYTEQQLKDLGDHTIELLVHPDDRFRIREQNAAAQALPDGEVARIRYRIRVADDSYRWLARSVTPFARNSLGQVTQLLGLASDVTDVVQVEQRLADAALHDPLTGLPNRTLLADRLSSTLARTSRSGHQLAVLFCDLDGFKAVNDSGGHAAGDAVLEATARRLLAALRAEDTAARVGGDEFVVVLEPSSRGWAGPDGAPIDVRAYAVLVAERIEQTLAQPVDFDGHQHVVTVSIGLAFAQAGDDVEEILAQADAAMYQAKSLGKNRHEMATGPRRIPVR
jgi:diguanylate cyclase